MEEGVGLRKRCGIVYRTFGNLRLCENIIVVFEQFEIDLFEWRLFSKCIYNFAIHKITLLEDVEIERRSKVPNAKTYRVTKRKNVHIIFYLFSIKFLNTIICVCFFF